MPRAVAAKTKAANGRTIPPTWRRQFNEAFVGPDGRFSITKAIAVIGQVVALWHFNAHFIVLVEHWDSLLVILGFIVAPDTLKKMIAMKYSGGTPPEKVRHD